MAQIFKRVNEKFAIGLDWSSYLGTGETISSAEVTVIPAGLTKEGGYTINGGVVSQVVSGGTAGKTYKVIFKVTTSAGAIYEDIYDVKVI